MKKNRLNVLFVVSAVFIVSAMPGLAQAQNITSIWYNNEAIDLLGEEQKYEAYQTLLKAIGKSPFDPVLHYNLGVILSLNEEMDKAVKSYQQAAKISKSEELKFFSFFNAGNALAAQKKVDEALAMYQKALNIRPDSVEAKTNIELLLKGGGGSGEGESKEKKPDEKEGEEKSSGKEPQEYEQQPKKPQPFKAKDLSEEDVKKILEELERQEQKIRGKYEEKKAKEVPNGKDW